MKKIIMTIIITLVLGVLSSVSVFAKVYDETFPAYVNISGGAWIEVQTSQGRITVIVPSNYIHNTFGFSGNGNNVANLTNAVVSGNVFHSGYFSYYGSPRTLQCRFTSMGTLEVYEPYYQSGYTYQRWTSLPITQIYATNIALEDTTNLDRQNNRHLYTTTERIMMFISILGVGLILITCLRSAWKA